MNFKSSQVFANAIRRSSLKMVACANASHVGSCLSVADILAVLYRDVLRGRPDDPEWPERDRFLLSKGHAAAALYSALALRGYFPADWLERFGADGSPLQGHVSHHVPGVELSTGSLGHGLPVACGMALAGKRDGTAYRVFCVLSDGELNEGSNWEAILFAAHHGLDNLVVIVDANELQGFGRISEVMALEPLVSKWASFGWAVEELDGHDHRALAAALTSIPLSAGRPTVIVARTVKGKGVSFMEGKLEWHYRAPNAEVLAQALSEVPEA